MGKPLNLRMRYSMGLSCILSWPLSLSLMLAERVLKSDGRVVIWDKFLPDHTNPSLLRRLLNVVTGALFSEINRQLGTILLSAPKLQIEHSEKAEFGGAYKIVLLRKYFNTSQCR